MAQSFRILLVEDDDTLRACLLDFLASEGWSVGATAFAAEALAMARSQRFDFSILDFHLPGTTGLQLFQQLASMRPLPAILMSGLASPQEAAAAHAAGFFAFLRKPLELGRLRNSLEALIQTHFGGPIAMPSAPIAAPVPPTTVGAASAHGNGAGSPSGAVAPSSISPPAVSPAAVPPTAVPPAPRTRPLPRGHRTSPSQPKPRRR